VASQYVAALNAVRRKCLFCGQPLVAGRSKEHVLPQWLQQHLSIAGHRAPLYTSGGVIERTSQTAGSYREGRVCTDCNTGWMSRLESDTRPILTGLVDGARTIASLNAAEKKTVALWQVKTALMLGSTALERPAQRPRFYADVKASRVPSGIVVVGHQRTPIERFPLPMEAGWLVNPGWVSPWPYTQTDEGRFRKLVPVSFKVTLWLRHLYLTCAYWPDNRWEILRWRGFHIPVSSSADRLRDHPWTPPPRGAYSDELMRLLHERLAVRRRTEERTARRS
jgi:hypothetical protein